MEEQKYLPLEIIYSNEKIAQFPYNSYTTLSDLKNYLSKEFFVPLTDIKLIYDRKNINDDNIYLSKLLLTSLSKIAGEKIKVKIIPQINLLNITKNFIFKHLESVDNEENYFNMKIDVIKFKFGPFKIEVFEFFSKKLEEFNYILDHNHSGFFDSPVTEQIFDNNFSLIGKIFNLFSGNDVELFFMVKKSSIFIYKEKTINLSISSTTEKEFNLRKFESLELRRNISEGQKYNVILQTYNSFVKEIEICPEMTVADLKDKIESLFGIKRYYQKLIYLVYKLNDDNKKLIDYYIRPQGIIFLRGFYFPIIFVDYFNRNSQNIIGINIAEQIRRIKHYVIQKLKLDYYDLKLITSGKELDEDKYLIDYNIQRMQTIYFK